MAGQRIAELTSGKHVAAPVGTTTPAREYAVTADRVVVARAVHLPDTGNGTARRAASGVFVVVRWTASRAAEPVEVRESRLVTADGRRFAPRVGLGEPAGSVRIVQPGFVLSWTTVFDVPPDLVPGAELVVPPIEWQAPLYDVTVHVPLPSSAAVDKAVDKAVDEAVAEPDEVRARTGQPDEVAHRGHPGARQHPRRRLLGGHRPRPGAHPRLVARAPAGTAARLATLDATLVSLGRGSSGQDGGPRRVPDGAALLMATVDISGGGGPEQPSVECQLRVAAPAPAPHTGPGASGRLRAWFAVPPDVELGRLVVEVRTVAADPRAVQLIPAPFG